jgi:hypothetical protein
MSLGKGSQLRCFLITGSAPGAEEIDHDNLTALGGETERLTLSRRPDQLLGSPAVVAKVSVPPHAGDRRHGNRNDQDQPLRTHAVGLLS